MTDEFVSAVRAMRLAQREYFKTRDPRWLRQSKEWEAKVDRMLAEEDQPCLEVDAA